MTEKDDIRIEKFFGEARRIGMPDRGFSRRVMRALPSDTSHAAHLWVTFCTLLGIILSLVFRVWQLTADYAEALLRAISAFELSQLNIIHLFTAAATILALIVRELVHEW